MHIYAFWHCGELLSLFLALVHMFALCVFAFDYQERRRCEEIGLLLDEALYLLLDDGSGLVLVTMHTLEVVPEFQKLKCFNVTLFFNDFLGLIIDVRIIFHLLEKYSHHFLFVIPRLAFAEVRLTVLELDLRQRLFVGFQISNHLFVFI